MTFQPLIQLIEMNAKHVHSNLALRYFREMLANQNKCDIDLCTLTINQEKSLQLMRILQKPAPNGRLLLFSAYIWNVQQMLELAEAIKAIEPEVIIVFGGPEVSFHNAQWLSNHPQVNMIVANEGEGFIHFLLDHIESQQLLSKLMPLFGTVATFERVQIDTLPLGYKEQELEAFHILYYEASRGCPYRCAFCMSAEGVPLRYKDLSLVESQLMKFVQYPNKIVKLIDRTFNMPPQRALEMLKLFERIDNGTVTFHLEVSPNGLSDEFIERVKTLRRGLVQFEVGIQSTNPQTLKAISRAMPSGVLEQIKKLCQLENCHTHVDLIAGLPEDTFESFTQGIQRVLSLKPDHLQLGMLKLLHGAPLTQMASFYGYKYDSNPPYTFHMHSGLTYGEKLRLECIEEGLERLHNVEKWPKSLADLHQKLDSPHQFYELVGLRIKEQALMGVKLSLDAVLSIGLKELHTMDLSLVNHFQGCVAVESFMQDHFQLSHMKSYAIEASSFTHDLVRYMQDSQIEPFHQGPIKQLVKHFRAIVISTMEYDSAVASGVLKAPTATVNAPELGANFQGVMLFKLKDSPLYFAMNQA